MTDGPVVHLAEPGYATACGRRSTSWSANDTRKVDCERCRGTLRFTAKWCAELGVRWPTNYQARVRLHQKRTQSTKIPAVGIPTVAKQGRN